MVKFIRLSIGKKLLLGFLSYGVVTLLIALFALSSLDQLNAINYSITQRDIPALELTGSGGNLLPRSTVDR
jgi:hypothetical protein